MTESSDYSRDLTPWFDSPAVPARPGPYKRRFPAGPFSCWDGRQWLGDCATSALAAQSSALSRYQEANWRGLASPSGEVCATCRGEGVIDEGQAEVDGLAPLRPCPDC